jgi:hypothetical protein
MIVSTLGRPNLTDSSRVASSRTGSNAMGSEIYPTIWWRSLEGYNVCLSSFALLLL